MFLADVSLRRRLLLKTLKLFDLLVLVLAFVFSCFLLHNPQVQGIAFQDFLAIRVSIQNVLLFAAILGGWHLIFSLCGLYQSRRLSSFANELFDIGKAVFFSAVLLHLLAFVFDIEIITFDYLAVFFLLGSGAVLASRLALRLLLHRIRVRGRNLRNTLIVGTNAIAFNFARKIENKKWLGYEIIGFVEDEWRNRAECRLAGDYPLVKFNDFVDFLRKNVVDEVVVCLPDILFCSRYSSIVEACEEQGVIVRFLLTNMPSTRFTTVKRDQLDDCVVLTVYTGAMVGSALVIKRLVDVLGASFLLFVFMPLLILITLVIKFTSPGPVFFLQERIGLHKRRFKLIKFRSMVADAEARLKSLEPFNEASGPVFKIKKDPRITPVGRFLRKTSLDELPQLLNVLKGDMSLVGPRPLPIRDYEGFDQDWHRRRFSARPGLTCLWQVEGRNSIPFERWMELDLYYIDHWSLWLDFKILLKTIPAVLKGSGS